MINCQFDILTVDHSQMAQMVLFQLEMHFNIYFKSWKGFQRYIVSEVKYLHIPRLFGPTMSAVNVGANVVKSHLVFSTARLGLEEDCLSMLALGTRMILRSGQCRVADDVWNDLSDFVDLVHDFIHVDAITVGQLQVEQ